MWILHLNGHNLMHIRGKNGDIKWHWLEEQLHCKYRELLNRCTVYFLWVWFQCVCPLMPSCNTYRLTWVSLTLGVGYLFTAAPAKPSHCSLPWTRGISSLPPFDLQRGIAPLGAPAPAQPRLLGRGVAPPGHRPWPRAWGSSSLPRYVHWSQPYKILWAWNR